ncbi:MAG: hypothetical protein KGY50_01230 [Candidatus Thermoplasmatota archaeon]|nr:hypothetical protein [Candidatus Thermoplasmatota archaeon]
MNKTNAELLKDTLFSLCKVSGRRTSDEFAYKVMNTIVSSLKQRYTFFDQINIAGASSPDQIQISNTVNSVDSKKLLRAVETVIRIVHMDLEDNAGLYFIKELRQQMDKETLFQLTKNGVDLSLLEMEQQHAYQYRQQRKKMAGDTSLLGYTWKDVSNWKYDDLNNVCILYDQNDNILDKLNLDAIIKEHIDQLTGSEQIDDLSEIQTERFKKEYKLLHLLRQKDMDIDTALSLLQVDQDELEHMIERLLNLGLLEYLDFDVVKLSEKGLKYIEQH